MNERDDGAATRRRRARTMLAVAAGCAAAPVALLAGAEPSLAWLGAAGGLAAAQLVVGFRARHPSWQRASLLATVLQGLLAAGRTEGPLAPVLVLATLASALLALGALAEQEASAALAPRLPRSGAARAPRSLAARGGAAAAALATALVLLLLAPLFTLLVDGARAALALLDPRSRPQDSASSATAAEPAPVPGLPDPAAASANEASFPASLEWASASPVEDDTPVVVLRWTPGPGAEPPPALHVRGRVLERFTETGLAARPASAAVELDGRRGADGWTPLEPGPSAAAHELHEFEVEQVPLRVGARAESLLFTPAVPVALDCPGALLRGEAELSAPLPASERLAFRVRSADRAFRPELVPAGAARRSPARALELPPSSPELEALRALARAVTRGATDDRERVVRVLAFFREQFVYEPKPTGITGLAGLVQFVERRAGSCTHYAATAALMLRTLGLPTRVATGFLALPSDARAGTFVATLRNGHAWFEVAFDGVGWVTCDATPGGSSNPGAALAAEAAEEGGWSALAAFFGRFLGGERLGWRDLALELPTGRGALLVLAGILGLGLAAGLRAARRSQAAEPGTPRGPGPSPALERLLLALARAGVPRPATRTLREHARELAARGDGRLAPLEPLVEALYRSRFGSAPWSDPDERALARVLAALASGSGG